MHWYFSEAALPLNSSIEMVSPSFARPYLIEARILPTVEVDMFACYIINEIDKVDEQLSGAVENSDDYSFLKGKKEALEDLRNAYNIIKKWEKVINLK